MASDEQRSPWLPVQPEGQPSDGPATPADTTEREFPQAAPPRETPPRDPVSGAASFDDLISPATPASRGWAGASAYAPPGRDAVAEPAPADDARPEAETPASDGAPSDPTPPPVVPVRSPYLNAERPRSQHSAYQPPSQAATAQEAWGIDRRATPPATGAIPAVIPAVEATQVAPSKPAVPYAPWTGSVPVVTPATTEIPMPAPAASDSGLVNGLVPTPIEAEDADIIAPVQPPAASEIQPQSSDADDHVTYTPPAGVPSANPYAPAEESSHVGTDAGPQPEDQEFTPDAGDPVKMLGASALSTARLEAAGAPTPRAGVPLAFSGGDNVPSFGEEQPFVPRFEPLGGVVPSAVPSVSFTEPTPTPRPVSPLSDVAIPESDEPAYVPKAEWGASALTPMAGAKEPVSAPVPTRPWAAVDPGDVEFVTGEPIAPELGTFGPEADAREAGPADDTVDDQVIDDDPVLEDAVVDDDVEPADAAPLAAEEAIDSSPSPWEYAAPSDAHATAVAAEDAAHEPEPVLEPQLEPEEEQGDAAAPYPVLPEGVPMSPAASFFAATAARGARPGDVPAEPEPWVSPFAPIAEQIPAEADVEPDFDADAATPDTATEAYAAFAAEPEPQSEEILTPELEPDADHLADSEATPASGIAAYGEPEPMSELPPSIETEPELEPEPEAETPFIPLHRDVTRTEPLRTTDTPYTPSQGAWGASGTSNAASTEASGTAEAGTTPMPWKPVSASAHGEAVTSEASARSGEVTTSMPSLASPKSDDAAARALAPDAVKDDQGDGERSSVGAAHAKGRSRGRTVLLFALVAVVAAAAGILVYRAFFLPEPVYLPVPTVTAAAPTPMADPIEVTEASAFVEAMPTVVGTDVLVSYVVADAIREANLPARAAEHVSLAYGPELAKSTYEVEAYQHYTVEDAQVAYEAYADGASDVEDVVVDGETVGQRALIESGADGTLVWRNGTAVFVLTGPAKSLLDFFAHYGV